MLQLMAVGGVSLASTAPLGQAPREHVRQEWLSRCMARLLSKHARCVPRDRTHPLLDPVAASHARRRPHLDEELQDADALGSTASTSPLM